MAFDFPIIQLKGQPFIDQCGSPWRPNRLTGMLQLWMTLHFSSSDNIVEPGLKQRIWNPDFTRSQIQILPVDAWMPQTTEQRPAIILKRHELKFIRYGIDNRLMGGGIPQNTQRLYSGVLQGAHTLFCIAGEGGEAEQLAAEVSQEVMKFAPIVRVWLNFLRIELVSIGTLAKLEEASENFAVPIDIAYAFQENWQLAELDSPVLTAMQMLLNT